MAGGSVIIKRALWTVVITLRIDPVNPRTVEKTYAAYNVVDSRKGPDRETYSLAMGDIPASERDATVEP